MSSLRTTTGRPRPAAGTRSRLLGLALLLALPPAAANADHGRKRPPADPGASRPVFADPSRASGLVDVALAQSGKEQKREGDDLTNLSLEELLQQEITTINVLGGHTHTKGEWMVAYRYMFSEMGGYRDGTRDLSDAEVLARGFANVHTRMSMEMHMLEGMYAPTERWTLMAMLPYHVMSMDHVGATGGRFTTHAQGIGDFTVMSLYTFAGDARHHGSRFLLNAGMSFPTGSIDKRDSTPTVRNAILEYLMQPGSGTFDLLPGITWLGESEHFGWGAQALGTLRLGRNDRDYRRGHRGSLTAWGTYKLADWVAPSLRVDAQVWGDIEGRDPEINPASNPESRPDLQGGRRVDLLFGMHFFVPRGTFRDTRLSVEGGFPVYQSLSGPQLETDWTFSVGVSRSFR